MLFWPTAYGLSRRPPKNLSTQGWKTHLSKCVTQQSHGEGSPSWNQHTLSLWTSPDSLRCQCCTSTMLTQDRCPTLGGAGEVGTVNTSTLQGDTAHRDTVWSSLSSCRQLNSSRRPAGAARSGGGVGGAPERASALSAVSWCGRELPSGVAGGSACAGSYGQTLLIRWREAAQLRGSSLPSRVSYRCLRPTRGRAPLPLRGVPHLSPRCGPSSVSPPQSNVPTFSDRFLCLTIFATCPTPSPCFISPINTLPCFSDGMAWRSSRIFAWNPGYAR